jgi:hypothetical protein
MLYMLTGNTRGKLDEMACTTLRWFCMRARAAAASPDLAAICLRRRCVALHRMWLHHRAARARCMPPMYRVPS